MIPREILKNIRPIELRTNRIVTELARGAGVREQPHANRIATELAPGARLCEPQHSRLCQNVKNSVRVLSCATAAGRGPALRSFQTSPQLRRISRAVPDGGDNDFGGFAFDNEVNRIRPRFGQFGFLCQPTGKGESFRVLANGFEKRLQLFGESLADSRLALILEIDSLGEFPFRLLFNDDPKRHCLARNRFSMSATTSSSGRQRSGCANARSARRSSSAICSGDKSGSYVSSSSWNSFQRLSKTCCFSFAGSGRICSIISETV